LALAAEVNATFSIISRWWKRGFQLCEVILSIKLLLRLLLTSISVFLKSFPAPGLLVNSCGIIKITCETGAFLNVPHKEFPLLLFTAGESCRKNLEI
jgi:hypothetical protein